MQSFTSIFMPGHEGVRNNEVTDKLASLTPVTGERAVGQAAILSVIQETGQTEDSGMMTFHVRVPTNVVHRA